MSSTKNTDLAIEYLRRMERNDLEGALSLATDDATFWIPGPGDMSKDQLRAFFAPLNHLVGKLNFTIEASTAEGERVALEVRGEASLTNGRLYRNRYHFLFVVRDGKITQVREYADSAPAKAAFFD